MKRTTYMRLRRLSTALILASIVGIIWTCVAGRKQSDSLDGDEPHDNLRTPSPTSAYGDLVQEGDYPPGPFILKDQSSEMVALPFPPTPNLSLPPRDCPWEEPAQFVVWKDDWNVEPRQELVLPSGTRVLLEASPTVPLGRIVIPVDTELIIRGGVALDVEGIRVLGTLSIGSETCPITATTPVSITLHGTRPQNAVVNPPEPAVKGIHVAKSGQLQLHGQRFFPSWTRLAHTVDPIAEPEFGNMLLLMDPVNWLPGQQVVVVTSALKDSRDWHQNEVRTVASVVTDPRSLPKKVKAAVYLTEPLQFRHVANKHYQVEVGLLSRSIIIQGSADDSEAVDPDPLNCTSNYVDFWETYDKRMSIPCTHYNTTGYGGHIMVEGFAQVEGVELYRMGQTNLPRYPFLFSMLGECPSCYFKHSSIHRSFYRCAVVQGTNSTIITENVAYNAIGHCFMLTDGVEESNTISYNLAAFIHWLGPEPARSSGRAVVNYYVSEKLAFPADTSASGFFIPNLFNRVLGNAASGGWAGFFAPNLDSPLGVFREYAWSPSSRPALLWDGNTAHSTAFWWRQSAAFFIGGTLFYNGQGELEYTHRYESVRDTCSFRMKKGDCDADEKTWSRLTNSKAFLIASYGLHAYDGEMEIDGFEGHDTGNLISVNTMLGIWMNRMLHVCRTGEFLALPEHFKSERWLGSSIWFEVNNQKLIISNSIFRQCGVRDELFNQYNDDPTRGCPADGSNGSCDDGSSVFYYSSFKDNLLPDIGRLTSNITYENCGRRFMSTFGEFETNQAMLENWIDHDGTTAGLGEETYIVSGTPRSRLWWDVDDNTVLEPQRPSYLIRRNDGPQRALAHIEMLFDEELHDQVGKNRYCYQKMENCPQIGTVRHLGPRFTPDPNDSTTAGFPITALAEINGMTGGFGWLMEFTANGPPRNLVFQRLEVDPDSVLMLSIKYPAGATFEIRGITNANDKGSFYAEETFQQTDSLDEVRSSGNKYHVASNGILTLRLVAMPSTYVGADFDNDGTSEFSVPNWDTPERGGSGYALARFEREGMRLPISSRVYKVEVNVQCAGNGKYCEGEVAQDFDPDVCPSQYTQVGYDRCCRNGFTDCKYPGDV